MYFYIYHLIAYISENSIHEFAGVTTANSVEDAEYKIKCEFGDSIKEWIDLFEMPMPDDTFPIPVSYAEDMIKKGKEYKQKMESKKKNAEKLGSK